jgi:hypothetical protein
MLSLDIMFDALFLNGRSDGSFRLRVPLVARVDYRGFRAIAYSSIPINNSMNVSPTLGFFGGVYSCNDEQLKSELGYVGDSLNLKDAKTMRKGQGNQFENVPVSSAIKIQAYEQGESEIDSHHPLITKKTLFHQHTELEYIN